MGATLLHSGLPPAALLAGALIIVTLTALGQLALARRLRAAKPGKRDAIAAVPRLGLAILVLAYFLTRLIALTRLPVFIDEALHILWAQQPTGRYLLPQLLVGKWLPVQLMSITLWAPCEALCGARLATVLAGLATLLACVRLQSELFSPTEALLAGTLYLLLPFALLYDRMALADPFVTAFGAWSVAFASRAAHTFSPWPAVASSLCVAAATLSKPTGGVFAVIPIAVAALLAEPGRRAAYLRLTLPTTIGAIVLVVYLLAGGYGTGLLSSQAAAAPVARLQLFASNLRLLDEWLTALLTGEIVLAGLISVAWGSLGLAWGARREAFLVVLLLLAVLPYLALADSWYPQYVHFSVVPIALLLGRFTVHGASLATHLAARAMPDLPRPTAPLLATLVVAALCIACFRKDVLLLTQPQSAGLPAIESSRYISGGLSGYGLPEMVRFLRGQSLVSPLNVVRFDQVGPAHQGLDVYLEPSDSLRLSLLDPASPQAQSRLAEWAAQRRTLFVSNPDVERSFGIRTVELLGRSQRIWQSTRPGSTSGLEVWEVLPR